MTSAQPLQSRMSLSSSSRIAGTTAGLARSSSREARVKQSWCMYRPYRVSSVRLAARASAARFRGPVTER